VNINIETDLKPKLSIVGYPGVGKTTISNLLKTSGIPIKKAPYIDADIFTLKVGKLSYNIWDYTGKEQFRFLWEEYIKDSDLVLIVTDSTKENVEKSKFFLDIIRSETPDAKYAVIANKQDLEKTLEISEIEKILGIKTFSLIATNCQNNSQMIKIVANLLNVEEEMSHQLDIINQIKFLSMELEKVLEINNYQRAIKIIEVLINLAKDIEEEDLKKELNEQIKKIKGKLEEPISQEISKENSSISLESEPDDKILIRGMIKNLLINYLNDLSNILAVIISDHEGNIIAYEHKKEFKNNYDSDNKFIEIPESLKLSTEKESRAIRVICPICKTQKKINVPQNVIDEAQNVVTFSIPKKLICDHHFQVFVDKNLAIRGYQIVDYEIDGYLDKILYDIRVEDNFTNIIITEDKKLAYCSKGPNSIMMTIALPSASDIELRVYSEHVATKVEKILSGEEYVSMDIPQIIKTMAKTRGGELPVGKFANKTIITGDYSVGKSSLIKRFVQNFFQEDYQSTIGTDISHKILELNKKTRFDFVIWDIGGQISQIEPYRKRYYSGANSAFIVFDLTRPETLKGAEIWYQDIKKFVSKDVDIILIANKNDVKEEIIISDDDVRNLAEKFGSHYLFTSAKTGENVNEAFLYLAYKFLEAV
jgi:small GTP-binding protein